MNFVNWNEIILLFKAVAETLCAPVLTAFLVISDHGVIDMVIS